MLRFEKLSVCCLTLKDRQDQVSEKLGQQLRGGLITQED